MGITGTIIGATVGAALIGGGSGAAVYHYSKKRAEEEQYQQVINYKRQFQNANFANRRAVCRYSRMN
jgi:hypothetical protein